MFKICIFAILSTPSLDKYLGFPIVRKRGYFHFIIEKCNQYLLLWKVKKLSLVISVVLSISYYCMIKLQGHFFVKIIRDKGIHYVRGILIVAMICIIALSLFAIRFGLWRSLWLEYDYILIVQVFSNLGKSRKDEKIVWLLLNI